LLSEQAVRACQAFAAQPRPRKLADQQLMPKRIDFLCPERIVS